jgi:hypothetical protein
MLGPKIDVSANQKKASGDDDVGDGGGVFSRANRS